MDQREAMRELFPPEVWEQIERMHRMERGPEPTPDSCPLCGASQWIPVVYGMPGFELFEKADRGEVILGGCVVSPDGQVDRCGRCGAGWTGFEMRPANRSFDDE